MGPIIFQELAPMAGTGATSLITSPGCLWNCTCLGTRSLEETERNTWGRRWFLPARGEDNLWWTRPNRGEAYLLNQPQQRRCPMFSAYSSWKPGVEHYVQNHLANRGQLPNDDNQWWNVGLVPLNRGTPQRTNSTTRINFSSALSNEHTWTNTFIIGVTFCFEDLTWDSLMYRQTDGNNFNRLYIN